MATATRSWRWDSPWAPDKGRTEARPTAWASGCRRPRFCILSRERRWDPLSPSPGEPQARGTCSGVRISVPSLPILHLPSGCLHLGHSQAPQTQRESALLRRKWHQRPPTTEVRKQDLPYSVPRQPPGPAEAVAFRSWLAQCTRAQLLVHMSSLKSAVVGVHTTEISKLC